MRRSAVNTIAACFALAAFAIAIVAGLASGNDAASILRRATVGMLVCYPIGLGVGMVANRIVGEHVSAHREKNPVPDEASLGDGAIVGQDVPAEVAPDSEEDVIVV